MEAQALIEFTNLAAVLQEYGTTICEKYRAELAARGKNASGILADTVRYLVKRDKATYAVDLSLADYWQYVEYGRRPGKFPPPDKILEWVRVKPVIPQPLSNGKLPTEKQLAFLIGRKIAREGIAPTPALATAGESTFDEFLNRIGEAISADLTEAVDIALSSLAQR